MLIKSTVIDKILKERGVSLEELTPFTCIPEYKFINQEEAQEQYIKNMMENKKVGILYDVDVDGLSSGKIIEEYTKLFGVSICRYMNKGKKHGMNKEVMDWIYKNKVEYLIVVDAGTGDVNYYDELNEKGVDVLVLDHHQVGVEGLLIRDGLVIVNCNYEGSPNIYLSGAGVVYRFIRELDKTVGLGNIERYKNWVGLSVLSDSCYILDGENRHYVNYLYKHYVEDLFLKQFKNYGSLESMFNFDIIPLLNACVRMDEVDIAIDLVTVSNEKKLKELIDLGKVIREKQKKLVDELKNQVKIIEGRSALVGSVKSSENYRGVLGLLAGKYCKDYGKACIILQNYGDEYRGSFRGIEGLTSDELDAIGIRNQGHKKACGVFIKRDEFKDKVKKLLDFEVDIISKDLWELQIDHKDYMYYYRDLHRIAFLNEMTGNGFEKIYIKINNLLNELEVIDREKVRRTRYMYFEVVDFGKSDNIDNSVVVYPCLNKETFTLVKAVDK